MRKSHLLIYSIILASLFACAANQPPPPPATGTPTAPLYPITPIPSPGRAQIFHTQLSTATAREVITDCFQKFGFIFNSNLSGDYFFQAIRVNTYDGHSITATCRWKKDGDTEITFESNLEKPQYDYLFAAVGKAVALREANPVTPPNP